jgi:UDP-3-O-[3-hydroxymyristoyl] N-acetylglucosamine deacetylase
MQRRTISRDCKFEGVGLHSGHVVTMELLPTTNAEGIVFIREDIGEEEGTINASVFNVVETPLCTRIVNSAGASLSCIEHLMSALCALRITDLVVKVNGPELPILDGSAAIFWTTLQELGTAEIQGRTETIIVDRQIIVRNGSSVAKVEPSEKLSITFSIDFEDAAIGKQVFTSSDPRGAFFSELAQARTFCRMSDFDAMREHGLALGGSLENAVVVDGEEVLTPGGLRYPTEAVRHKILDALGDLWLGQVEIIGKFTFERSGHTTNLRLLRKILDSYPITQREPQNVVQLPFANPNLDLMYGTLVEPEYCSDEERVISPESIELLDSKSATLLRALMETAVRELGPSVATFSQLPFLWVINKSGQMVFSIEEIVSDGSKRFIRPRLRRDQPLQGETRLGHPSLVDGQPARIGGELYFDPGWGHEPRGWKITNGSGRYGLREGREVSHLLNVVDLLRSHNVDVRPNFIPLI